MKKIIALAVAGAFVAPVMAADVTISGSTDMTYENANTGTTLTNDSTFTVKASGETGNGITVSTDINFNANGDDDGSGSLTLEGAFGKIDMGDTSNALDAVDDITDVGYAASSGTGAGDAGIGWTLPTLIPNVSVYLSHSPDSTPDSVTAGNGASVKYSGETFSVAYGEIEDDAGTSENIANVKISIQGIGAGYEARTVTSAAGDDVKHKAVGLQYTMGNITLAYENYKVEGSDGVNDNDYDALMAHYSLGGGVTAYVETKEDSVTANSDVTYVGVAFAF